MSFNRHLAPGVDTTLLKTHFSLVTDSVVALRFPVKSDKFPPIVNLVRSFSSFSGFTLHTILPYATHQCLHNVPMDSRALLSPEKYVLLVLEAAGLGETGVLCALTWLFPRLEFVWGADGNPVVYCRMASQESGNAPSFPCLQLLGYPLVVQV